MAVLPDNSISIQGSFYQDPEGGIWQNTGTDFVKLSTSEGETLQQVLNNSEPNAVVSINGNSLNIDVPDGVVKSFGLYGNTNSYSSLTRYTLFFKGLNTTLTTQFGSLSDYGFIQLAQGAFASFIRPPETLTANRTYTLPDRAGEFALAFDLLSKANLTGGNTFSGIQSFNGNITFGTNNTSNIGTSGAAANTIYTYGLRSPSGLTLDSGGAGFGLQTSGTTRIQLASNGLTFYSSVTGATALGNTTFRWGAYFGTTGNFTGEITTITPTVATSAATKGYVDGLFLTATATLDFPSTAAGTSSDLTVTVTGAVLGDVVTIGVPNASVVNSTCYSAWVSAADTVTVRHNNYSATPSNPASGTFKVKVLK